MHRLEPAADACPKCGWIVEYSCGCPGGPTRPLVPYDPDHPNLEGHGSKAYKSLNLVTDDNRWENLREATRTQNNANMRVRIDNRCGLKGVSYHKVAKKWAAKVHLNGEGIYLGLFLTPQEAHDAYAAAAEKIFGEFARKA